MDLGQQLHEDLLSSSVSVNPIAIEMTFCFVFFLLLFCGFETYCHLSSSREQTVFISCCRNDSRIYVFQLVVSFSMLNNVGLCWKPARDPLVKATPNSL